MSCKKLCGNEDCQECFNKSFASHYRVKWWSERNIVNPRNVTISSGEKYEFNCDCGHYFESSLSHINTMKSWCPYCANKKLCGNRDCKMCFNKSFASHYRVKWWSERNNIDPLLVSISSNKKYEFNCDCGHQFSSLLDTITKINKPVWCPYCCTPVQKLCTNENCQKCFNNSFASCDRTKWWSERNEVSPRSVSKGTRTKYEFKCDCGHYFKKGLAYISGPSRKSWCPYCGNQRLCDDENCKMCFKNSFASHNRAKWWSERNKVTPRQISRRTGTKYEFKCEKGHYFKASPDNVSKQDEPRWCPFCKNKSEQKLYEWLVTLYNDCVYQYKPEWCRSPKTNKYMPFDIFLPSLNIIVEIDGDQHFRQVANWGSPEHNQSKDLYKMKLAFDNNITIIRIPYEFVSKNIYFTFCKLNLYNQLYKRKSPEIIVQTIEDDDNRYDYVHNFNFLEESLPTILDKH